MQRGPANARFSSATQREEQATTITYLVIHPETGEGQAGKTSVTRPRLLLTPGAPPVLDGAEVTPLGWASPCWGYTTPSGCSPGLTAVLYSMGLVEEPQAGSRRRVSTSWSGSPRGALEELADAPGLAAAGPAGGHAGRAPAG